MCFIHSKQLSTIFLFLEGSLSLSLPLQASLPAAAGAATLALPALLQAATGTQEGLVIKVATMHFTLASSVYKEGCFPQLLYF